MGLGKTLTVLALILKDKEIHEENQEKKSKDVDASTATGVFGMRLLSNVNVSCPLFEKKH